MSKTFVVEVTKRGTVKLPGDFLTELPAGTRLAVKRGRNGNVVLAPLREPEQGKGWSPADREKWEALTQDLRKRAKELGLTTQKQILAEIKRVRSEMYGTSRSS